jgi:1-acyl-sn-glycerol-3-phosphate acyltransferase
MSVPGIIAGLVIYMAAILCMRWAALRYLTRGPGGNVGTGLIWLTARALSRLVQRAVFEGLEHVPDTNSPGAMIVVSNHTGAVDSILLQAACRFEIRWMMASEFMTPSLDWLWRRQRVIPVDRDGKDTGPLREAIRHVKDGGVIGIFPEGRIVRPQGEVRPFHDGVGLLIARTRAPVLLAWISGTPAAETAAGSMFTPCRARVVFIGLLRFDEATDAADITQELRRRIADVSGWPLNDQSMPPLEPLAA